MAGSRSANDLSELMDIYLPEGLGSYQSLFNQEEANAYPPLRPSSPGCLLYSSPFHHTGGGGGGGGQGPYMGGHPSGMSLGGAAAGEEEDWDMGESVFGMGGGAAASVHMGGAEERSLFMGGGSLCIGGGEGGNMYMGGGERVRGYGSPYMGGAVGLGGGEMGMAGEAMGMEGGAVGLSMAAVVAGAVKGEPSPGRGRRGRGDPNSDAAWRAAIYRDRMKEKWRNLKMQADELVLQNEELERERQQRQETIKKLEAMMRH